MGGVTPAGPICTFGEGMLRLSVPPGELLSDAASYNVHVAGAEANVAVALARVGVPALWSSALPQSPLGVRITKTLADAGVDVSAVQWADGGRVGVYFAQLDVPPRPAEILYDRRGSAIAQARPDGFAWEVICGGSRLHLTGISFALSEAASAVARRAVDEARARGVPISFDVNYREQLTSPELAAAVLLEIAPSIDTLICRADDAALLLGIVGDAEATALALRERLQIERVVVTDGANGAVGADDHGTVIGQAYGVNRIVDRIGAGDSFAAGILWGLRDGSLAEGVDRGLAMAALKLANNGDHFTADAEAVAALRGSRGRSIVG
jgi:2-dehydro-3-deoxygluconokinase